MMLLLKREIRQMRYSWSNLFLSGLYLVILVVCINFINLQGETIITESLLIILTLVAILISLQDVVSEDFYDGTLKLYMAYKIEIMIYLCVKFISQMIYCSSILIISCIICIFLKLNFLHFMLAICTLIPVLSLLKIFIDIIKIRNHNISMKLMILPLIIPQIIFLSYYLQSGEKYYYLIAIGISCIQMAMTAGGLLLITYNFIKTI